MEHDNEANVEVPISFTEEPPALQQQQTELLTPATLSANGQRKMRTENVADSAPTGPFSPDKFIDDDGSSALYSYTNSMHKTQNEANSLNQSSLYRNVDH